MLTRKTPVGDRVVGLRIGADHYLAKPFAPAKLLARIEVSHPSPRPSCSAVPPACRMKISEERQE